MKNENEFTDLSLIIKNNYINEAQHDMNLLEYKLILVAISLIDKDDSELFESNINIGKFAKLLEIKRSTVYNNIIKNIKKLGSKGLSMYDENKNIFVYYPWFMYIKYEINKGYIKLKFNPELAPFIIYLIKNKGYTKYLLKNVVHMESKYSMRIYELLKQYEKIGERIFDLQEIKLILGAEYKYKKYGSFKEKVLEKAKNEIYEKSDIFFTYQEIKSGVKVVKVRFIIKSKNTEVEIDTYESLSKQHIINLIQKKLKQDYNYTIGYKLLSFKHRIILIAIHKRILTLNTSSIRTPKSYFNWLFDDVESMYDIKGLQDKEDY